MAQPKPWERYGQQQPEMPANPAFQYEAPKAQADLQRTQMQTQGDAINNAVTQQTAPATVATASLPPGYRWLDPQNPAAGVEMIPGYVPPGQQQSAADKTDMEGRISRLNQLTAQINRVQTLYDQTVGKTKGVKGAQDYLPTDANAQFDTAGAALSQMGLAAFRVPGTGNVSDRDAIMFDRANLPTSGTRDAAILEQLRGLRTRVNEEMAALGRPIPQWSGEVPEDEKSVWAQNYLIPGSGPGAADFGARQKSVEMPPEMQAEHAAFIQQWMANPDPDAYAAFRAQLDQKYGFTPDANAYRGWADETAAKLRQGGTTVDPSIPNINADMTQTEVLRNAAANNPGTAAAIGIVDGATFGIPTALAGDQINAIRNDDPWNAGLMLGGEMLGSIAGTKGLGAIGANTVGRLAPSLIGGGSRAQLARDIGTDAVYSGIYGGITEGDPLTSGVEGTVGSIAGNALGKGLQTVAGGLKVSPGAQYLSDSGIRTTVGQKLGGAWKRAEDKMASLPIVGDMVAARQGEGIADFNRRMFEEGALGREVPPMVGEAGVDYMRDVTVPNAYGAALDGRQFDITPEFAQANTDRMAQAGRLPQEIAGDTQYSLNTIFDPAYQNGNAISGRNFQQVYQGLQRHLASLGRSDSPAAPEAAEILRGALDDLGGMVETQAPDVMPLFRDANDIYRNSKIIEDAVGKAVNTGGEVMPSQLGTAARTNSKRFGGRYASESRPFFELQRNAQDTLPSKVPNSGTVDRALQFGIGGSLLGAGTGTGAYLGGTEGATTGGATGLGILGALALGGTRGGQRKVGTALFGRGDTSRKAAELIARHRGMFGSAAIPLAISSE